MDESKLTPSEQVMLGIFKAQAGNQLDGELAFIRAKAPFGNWAPKPSAAPVQTVEAPAPSYSGPRFFDPGYAEYYGIVPRTPEEIAADNEKTHREYELREQTRAQEEAGAKRWTIWRVIGCLCSVVITLTLWSPVILFAYCVIWSVLH